MEQRDDGQRQREREYRRQKRKLRRRRVLFALSAGTVLLGIFFIVLPVSGIFRKELGQEHPAMGEVPGMISEFTPRPSPESFVLDAPFLDQREFYPTGCESVSAVMALQYFGVEIDTEEFIDGFLTLGNAPYEDETGRLVGCDPRESFPGDPRTEEGWGCYSPVIERALNDLLRDRFVSSPLMAESPENKSLPELCEEYVAKGIPVILWATIDMEPPEEFLTFFIEGTDEEFQWIYPLHCLLLTGWNEDGYFFNDPSAGKNQFYPREETEFAYEGLGRQALALVPVD